MQKHPNFWQFSLGTFQSSLRDRKLCVLSGNLSEISAELECMRYYLLSLFRINLILLLFLLLFTIYYCYLEFYIVPH